MAYSKTYSVKSNARRAARKAGANPEKVIATVGGWHFPLPAKKAAAQRSAKLGGALKRMAGKPVHTLKAATTKKKRHFMTGPAKPSANGVGAQHAEKIFGMMCDPKGATITEITKLTGWLPHTARARLSAIREAHKKTHTYDRQRILGETFYYAKAKTAPAKAAT